MVKECLNNNYQFKINNKEQEMQLLKILDKTDLRWRDGKAPSKMIPSKKILFVFPAIVKFPYYIFKAAHQDYLICHQHGVSALITKELKL